MAKALLSLWSTPRKRRLAFSLVAAVASALAFARITEDYLTNDPLARWDVSFARWLFGERSTVGIDFFRVVTFFGSPAVLIGAGGVLCVLLYRRRLLIEAALVLLVLGGTEALNVILKLSFHRARPEVGFVELDTYSYPSGHAMISAAAYGALMYLMWSRLGGRSRLLLAAGSLVLLALIGFSRLYLGVHYLSDVLAGISAGAFWLAISIALVTMNDERFARGFTDSWADRFGRRVTRS